MTESIGKIMEAISMCINGSEATKAHWSPSSAY